ncbi:unnamed protein product [Amoebophrya sp. A25]|nr:unnamed protein product [Amoebophrya sp. A25]|eukprot:GSA25T00008814001.1
MPDSKGVIRGALKLKGEPLQDASKKKKKKSKKEDGGTIGKSSSLTSSASSCSNMDVARPAKNTHNPHLNGSANDDDDDDILNGGAKNQGQGQAGSSSSSSSTQVLLPQSRLTESQKSFLIAHEKRQAEAVEKSVKLTHREKMERFNRHCAALSEHFDIPRVGPG